MPARLPDLLQGQVALVTGASSGIGRAAAIMLAEAGCDVALNYFSMPDSASAAAERIRALGRKALQFPIDVSDQKAVEEMVRETVAKLGRIDILVSSAVYSDRELFHAADMAGFRRTIEVTMMGAYYVIRAAAAHMIARGGGGNIVVVGSPHAHIAIPSCMAYNMAKAANHIMAKTAALELVPHRIRVNIIEPGWIDTAGERKFFSEEVLAKAAKDLPWGRMGRPEEIARGILFLVDPESDYVTGSTLSIDGGSQLPWWSKRGTGDF
jgi:glucose 1-dehydrogenase